MDSLKTLLDRQQYDLIIKLTANSDVASDIFYRIAAFTCVQKYEDALFCLQDHAQILEKDNLNSLINIHIELLCALERYEQAYNALDYYNNLPYHSQIVEETLAKMPELIENESKKKNALTNFTEDQIFELLNSKNSEEVLFALDLIKKLDVFTYLDEIAKILISEQKQTVRSFALMLLVQKEVDRELNYLSYKGLIKVNPKLLRNPFSGANFNRLVKTIDASFKNTTYAQSATQVLSALAIYIYPNDVDNCVNEMIAALKTYVSSLYGEEIPLEKSCDEFKSDIDKTKEFYSLIQIANSDF